MVRVMGYRTSMMGTLRERLERIKTMADPLQRKLWALAIVTKGLEPAGLRPILIGGTALEYYSLGGYATSDVDIALPYDPAVDRVFAELDFKKEGRYWVNDELDLLFEAPAGILKGEDAELTKVSLDDLVCYVLGLEDLIIDRLNGYVHWKWEDDGRWVRRLVHLYRPELDIEYLRRRANQEKTIEALETILKEEGV